MRLSLSRAAAPAAAERRTPSPARAPARQTQILLVLVVAWLALVALPAIPPDMTGGLDPGWVIGLNMAHAQGLLHGKDIVWTYGPLGYLLYPDASGHDLYRVLGYRLGVYLLWCAALLRLCFVESRLKEWIVILIAVCVLLDP